jgi:hypothetical protein
VLKIYCACMEAVSGMFVREREGEREKERGESEKERGGKQEGSMKKGNTHHPHSPRPFFLS